MFDKIKQLWDNIKAWFKYSETIFWARVQTAAGFLIAVFASVDWTQLAVSGISKETALLAAGLFINGLFTEYLRRRNANL